MPQQRWTAASAVGRESLAQTVSLARTPPLVAACPTSLRQTLCSGLQVSVRRSMPMSELDLAHAHDTGDICYNLILYVSLVAINLILVGCGPPRHVSGPSRPHLLRCYGLGVRVWLGGTGNNG